eukprot:6210787-Pleurochrysis_carterae.AAC.1
MKRRPSPTLHTAGAHTAAEASSPESATLPHSSHPAPAIDSSSFLKRRRARCARTALPAAHARGLPPKVVACVPARKQRLEARLEERLEARLEVRLEARLEARLEERRARSSRRRRTRIQDAKELSAQLVSFEEKPRPARHLV